MRDYYDDRITWDFTTILDANNTTLFTSILKIDQVFRFGIQHNPKWQSTTFKVYWYLDKSLTRNQVDIAWHMEENNIISPHDREGQDILLSPLLSF